MSTLTYCKMRDLGILTNEGKLTGYEYSAKQVHTIIKKLKDVLQYQDIDTYLAMSGPGGRLPYPDCVVKQIVRANKTALLPYSKENESGYTYNDTVCGAE